MAEDINFRINATRGSMEGLEALQRHLQDLLGPGTRAGFRRQLNIAANIEPGSTIGLEAAVRRAREVTQRTMLGVARQAEPGQAPALQGLLTSAQLVRQQQILAHQHTQAQLTVLDIARQAQPGQSPALRGLQQRQASEALQALSQRFGPLHAAQPLQAQWVSQAVAGGLLSGGTTGLAALAQQQARQTALAQHAMVSVAGQLTPGVHTGLLRARGFEALGGRYGGIQRLGAPGPGGAGTYGRQEITGMPAFVPPPMQPWPVNLLRSPFGPGAGGPQGPPLPPTLYPPPPGLPPPPGPPPGPQGPFSPWPGSWGQRTMGSAAVAAQQLPSQAAGLLPMLARGAGRLGAVAAGYGVYQAISTAMEAYETRARGVLSVGTLLDEQYGEVGSTLDDLRDKYHVLGRDGLAAMTALGRATGQFANVRTTTRFGRAYGMAPEDAATLAGTLTLMTGNLDPNLSAIAAVQRQSAAGGFRTLPVAPFAEEVGRIAAVGGTGFAPLQTEDYARYGALMTTFGPRYGAAPAQAYQQYAQGLGAPASNPAMEAVRRQALSRLAARQPVVMLGDRALHIRDNYADYQIALQNAGQIQEVQQEYYLEAKRQGVGNPGLQRAWYQGLFGTQNALQSAEQFEAMEKTGGPAGTLTRPIPPGEAPEAGRVGRAQQLGEYDVLRRAINLEEVARTDAIKALENWRTQILDSVGAVSRAYNENRGAVEIATEGLKKLSGELITLFGIAVSLRFPGLGGLITGAGVVKGLGELGAPAGGVPIEDILPPGHWALPPRPDPAATQPRKEH